MRIYCKNPVDNYPHFQVIYLFLFKLVHLQLGKVVIAARKPGGNYEGLYCKVASHDAPGKKKGLKCREVANSSSFAI